jgi:hypothetical protein
MKGDLGFFAYGFGQLEREVGGLTDQASVI